MAYTNVALFSLFYLLGMLSVDLIIDQSADERMQLRYYCTLFQSFSKISGGLRLVPAAILLAISSILASLASPPSSRRLHYANVFLLAFCGLPIFINTAMSVKDACSSGAYPASAIHQSHYAILAILMTCIVLLLISNVKISSRTKLS